MPDDLNDIIARQAPQPGRPLLGLTILVVEDSRFACEAMRLLCLHSGARLRRADCLRSARRHLQTYRPTVIIVDLGLPDGSGLELIEELARSRPRAPAILATSGAPELEGAALQAGADGFLAKPVERVEAFQRAILAALPAGEMKIPASATNERIEPDRIALRDDLSFAKTMLDESHDNSSMGYVAQFLSGIALTARDAPLAAAARAFAENHAQGHKHLAGLVQERLAGARAF